MTDDPKTEPDPESPTPLTDDADRESSPDGEEAARRQQIKIGSQREPAPPAADTADEPAEAVADTPDAATPSPTDEVAAPVFPPPRLQSVSEDLQREIDEALEDVCLDELLQSEARSGASASETIEMDQPCQARVIKIDRDSVFLSLGGHDEGLASLRQFPEPPAVGAQLEVVPVRFLPEDGLYELAIPGAAIDVQDWSDLTEGVVVQARITGHNKGGLECEVHHIHGFIPISQISLFRVEDLEPFVGQTLPCVVAEANPERRNLVLSHRAVLERERQESREKLLGELEVGQTREGIVRRLLDFGAFVDLGGVDGLVHISQLSWDRVGHPSEVLEEGQRIKVRVEKIDLESGKIGLSYRDLLEHPWEGADAKYPAGAIVEGTVTKIMDFGAFVRIAAGIEGLVHISELAHHRVQRVSTVVREGQTVQVKVLTVDPTSQKMSLSIKAVQGEFPEETSEDEGASEATSADSGQSAPPQPQEPLKGGLNRPSGGEQFGLNW